MTPPRTPGDGQQEPVIVRAAEADIGTISQIIAEAFFPLDVCRWLIGDETARRAIFPSYFRLYVEHALASGEIDTTADRSAAALWLPSTGPNDSPDGYSEQLAAITGPWLGRFMAFDEELEHHHPAGTLHHHLAILAVRPGRQGQGIGSALLRAHHTELAGNCLPAYLEAADQQTRQLYLAHGYADHGDPIKLPGGPAMYPMWLQPERIATGMLS